MVEQDDFATALPIRDNSVTQPYPVLRGVMRRYQTVVWFTTW